MVYLRYLIMANKPRIRFRGFTEDWEQCKLGDLYKRVNERNDGTLGRDKWISVAKMYFQDPDKVQSNNLDTRTYVMKKGDIAFEGHPNNEFKFGRFVLNDIGTGIISELFPIYRPITEYDLDFWKYAIQLERVMAPIFAKSITSSGNSSNKLDHNHFLNQELLVPNIEEQKKIGTLLSLLSKNITLHQHKLKKLNLAKKALLQKLFPRNGSQFPVVRFKGFTDAWEQRKLGDLAEIVRGASPRPISDPKWFDNNSDVGWLRIADVTAQDGRIRYLEQKISELGQEKTRVVKIPHLLLSIAATVGKPVINYVPTGVHDGFLIFLNPKFNILYTFWWLEMFREKWNKYGQPGSQVNLNSDLVKNQVINIPNEKEQEKISSFLESLDKIITLHQRKLEKLQEVKKGLLQKMFV